MGAGSNGQGSHRNTTSRQPRRLAAGRDRTRIPWEIGILGARYPRTTTSGDYMSLHGRVAYALSCGDGMDLLRRLPDGSVDVVLTDIPYNEVNQATNGLRHLHKGVADVLTFRLDQFVAQLVRVARGSFYVFCGAQQVSDLLRELHRHKLNRSVVSIRPCVWEKERPSPMNAQHHWLSALEFCVFARKPGAPFCAPMGKNLWRFETVRGKKRVHPTQKPLPLLQFLLQASSRPGDLVLDPCLGSGSTAVAALTLGRHIIGAELDPGEYQKAVRRVHALPAQQIPAEIPSEYRDLLI